MRNGTKNDASEAIIQFSGYVLDIQKDRQANNGKLTYPKSSDTEA